MERAAFTVFSVSALLAAVALSLSPADDRPIIPKKARRAREILGKMNLKKAAGMPQSTGKPG